MGPGFVPQPGHHSLWPRTDHVSIAPVVTKKGPKRQTDQQLKILHQHTHHVFIFIVSIIINLNILGLCVVLMNDNAGSGWIGFALSVDATNETINCFDISR